MKITERIQFKRRGKEKTIYISTLTELKTDVFEIDKLFATTW